MKFNVTAVLPSIALAASSLSATATDLINSFEQVDQKTGVVIASFCDPTIDPLCTTDSTGTMDSMGCDPMDPLCTTDSTGTMDSMGCDPLDPLCTTDSMGCDPLMDPLCGGNTADSMLTLPYHADQRVRGVWFITRDYIQGDGLQTSDVWEQVCTKTSGVHFIGQSSDPMNDAIVWGKIKNRKNQVVVRYSKDPATGGAGSVSMLLTYNPEEPWALRGTWEGNGQSGDVMVMPIQHDHDYSFSGCFGALGN